MRDELLSRFDAFTDIQRELENILQTLVLNDSTIIDALAQMLGAIQQMNARAEQTQAGVEKSQNRLATEVRSLAAAIAEIREKGPAGAPIVQPGDAFSMENPEIGLLQYLHAFIGEAAALDVGAHAGAFTERLLRAGYRVHAFEPYPPSFRRLCERLAGHPRFRGLPWAVGPADGTAELRIARDITGAGKRDDSLYNSFVDHPMVRDLAFEGTLPVEMRSLESLSRSGEIPWHVGLLKIDTEGFDLDVLAGMGDLSAAVVMVEFWDREHAFGQAGHGLLEPLAEALRRKGYDWHVVLYRIDETGTLSYYFDRAETVARSWGNAVFFRDHALFAKAARWCELVLLPTLHR